MTPLKRGKTYYAVWTCSGACNQHASPTRHWASLRTGDKREAQAACKALEARLDEEKVSLRLGLPVAARTDRTLGEYRTAYLDATAHDKAVSTGRTEKCHLGSLIEYLGENFRLANLTQDVLEGYKRHRLERIAPRSWNSELATLKSVFAWGLRREPPLYAKNPFSSVSRVDRGAPTVQKYVQSGDLQKVLAACTDPFWRNVLLFGYYTFCRGSELRGLRWVDVDFALGTITFQETKERKKKTVPIIPAVREILDSALTYSRTNDYVFPGRDGQMTKDALHHKLQALGAAVNVKLSPHMLRHSGITDALNAGAPLFAVQKQAGHSQVTTTAGYGHMELVSQGEVMNKLVSKTLAHGT